MKVTALCEPWDKLFKLVLILIISCFTSCHTKTQSSEKPRQGPNILLITADDLGLQLGCYGDTIARTPYLDQFAEEYLKLTNAYVTQASCSPSRSSILTGLYPHQNGTFGLAHLGYWMPDSIRTLPQILKGEGYHNGIIGKLHVEPEASFPFDYANLDAKRTREVKNIAKEAETFIKRADKPFFLMVNYFDPHVKLLSQVEGLPKTPYTIDEVSALPYQKVDTEKQLRRISNFYSCVERLDTGFGMLMESLKKTGKYDNTIIMFIGDHGPPFSGAKGNCYEAGIKVPFLIKWPQDNSGVNEHTEMVSTIDVVPTILDWVGLQSPDGLPGISLKPLSEKQAVSKRSYLFSEFSAHGYTAFYPMRSVRNNRYKMIINYLPDREFPMLTIDGDKAWKEVQKDQFTGTEARSLFARYQYRPEVELYDLQKDPHELRNIAADALYENTLSELQEALKSWQEETQDPMADLERKEEMINIHDRLTKMKNDDRDFQPEMPLKWVNE